MSTSASRLRDRVVAFRLDPADHDVLRSVAAPLSPGQWARHLSMSAAGLMPAPPGRRPLPKVADAALLRQVLAELGHIGGNINQIAHWLNAGHPAGSASIDALRADLQPVKRRLLLALGVEPE